MPSSIAEGTQLAVIATEHTLHTNTANKHYAGLISLTNMASGDITEIRAYIVVKSGGAQEVFWEETFHDEQPDDPGYPIPFVSCVYGYKLTLKQTAGTGRNYDWRVDEP